MKLNGFIFGIVFLLFVSIATAKEDVSNSTFLSGNVYDISSDKLEYNTKSGVICSDVEKKVDDRNLFDWILNKDDNETIKITGLENEIETKTQIEVGENKKICEYYNYPIGYFSKFNIESGKDILVPIINITNPYNESCVYAPNSTTSYSISGSATSTDVTLPSYFADHTTNGIFSTDSFVNTYTYYCNAPHLSSIDVDSIYYYLNGTVADTKSDVCTATVGTSCTITNTISSSDKIHSVDIVIHSDGHYTTSMSLAVFNKSCTQYFYDTYTTNLGYLNQLKLNVSSGCVATKDLKVSTDGTTYTTLTDLNYTFTPATNQFYFKINQTNCQWVNFNYSFPNSYVNLTFVNHLNGALYTPKAISFSIIDVTGNNSNNFSTSTGYAYNLPLYNSRQFLILTSSNTSQQNSMYMNLTLNTSSNIFILDDVSMTPVLFSVLDLRGIGLEGFDIDVYRFFTPTTILTSSWYYYIGTYKTSFDGTVVIPMTAGLYQYNIKKNGVVYKSASELFVPLSTNTRTFNIDTSAFNLSSIININNIKKDLYYNFSTDTFYFNWNDTNEIINQYCIDIYNYSSAGLYNYSTHCYSGIYGNNSYAISGTLGYHVVLYGVYLGNKIYLSTADGTARPMLDTQHNRDFAFIIFLISLALLGMLIAFDWKIAVVVAFGVFPYILSKLYLAPLPVQVATLVVGFTIVVAFLIWQSGWEVTR